ncbi:MAG: hypothetical protein EBU90_03600 [Proteobacteria bacterium]|nr:hypothetical protein [Pseudomonadota bacterium]NBP13690.1 hypothetical protein [bacterium]
MKFLIDNYCTDKSTQALYLYKNLNNHPDHEAFIRMNGETSIYDAFDKIKPDIYITSIFLFARDTIEYLKENKNTNIQIILCANEANQDMINKVEETFTENNIPCLFIFSNDSSIKTSKFRFVHLPECADLNNPSENFPQYKIDKAVFVNKITNIPKYNGTFHVLSTNTNIRNNVDISLPVHIISNLYNRYETIVFNDMQNCIPQAFFDAVARGNKVYYDVENKEIDELFKKIFKLDKSLNFNDPDRLDNFDSFRQIVLDKHLCTNRTKTLLSQIPNIKS